MDDATGSGRALHWGSALFALTGAALVAYAMLFIVWALIGNTLEVGIGPSEVGKTRAEIAAFEPRLLAYLEHLHVAVGGFMAGLGVAIIGLSWFGIRGGHAWSLWTVLAAAVIALIVSTPLHYVHGFDTLAHTGPLYPAVLLSLIAAWLSFRGLRSTPGHGKA